MKILILLSLIALLSLGKGQLVDYCFLENGGCSSCIGKYEINYQGDQENCIWCADGSFSDCDTASGCYGSVKTDCSVSFDSNAVGAIVLMVIFSLLIFCNLYCVCSASAASSRALDFQSKYNFSWEGYIRISDVLPPDVVLYSESALEEREKSELVWAGTSIRSSTWKMGCTTAAIMVPGVVIMVCLIAWLAVGTLLYFISIFIIGFLFCLFIVFYSAKYRKPPVFIMTPREALIIGDSGCGTIVAQRFPFAEMPSIDTVLGADGLGSIYFATRLVRTKHGYRTVRVGFENILNPKKIAEKMSELKQLCTPTTIVVAPGQVVIMNGQAMMMTPMTNMNGQVVMTTGQPMMMNNGQTMMMNNGQPMAQPMMGQPMMNNGQPVMMNNGQPVMMAQPMPMAQPINSNPAMGSVPPYPQPMVQQTPVYPQDNSQPPAYPQNAQPPPYNP